MGYLNKNKDPAAGNDGVQQANGNNNELVSHSEPRELTQAAPRGAGEPVVVKFSSAGAGSFDGEILQGQGPLSNRDELIAGLYLAYGLEHNAHTNTEWRGAFRVWMTSVVRWMQAEKAPPELLSLPAKMNCYLEELEEGRQPPRLTRVSRDAAGNPGVGFVDVTKPATGCALVDFLIRQTPAPLPNGTITKIEDEIASKIGWSASQFRDWRKKFNRGKKGKAAQRIYAAALEQAKACHDMLPSEEVVEILLRTAGTFGG